MVTSDVISAQRLVIHSLSWEFKDEFFAISNTNLSIKWFANAVIFTEIYLFGVSFYFVIEK